ncbi:hypothetical protein Naga_100167g14 [Nannochloropsis gaditana]|uniref:Uncharacterized protein n=1 Tax=Nannochloropsis gaditana TaxID=72520 RepID=W7T0K1_9STRA|nr:hypothetical protein Naga_100167g14 [Nannochloropsis gaditana]
MVRDHSSRSGMEPEDNAKSGPRKCYTGTGPMQKTRTRRFAQNCGEISSQLHIKGTTRTTRRLVKKGIDYIQIDPYD